VSQRKDERIVSLTNLPLAEKYAPTTASLWPANVFGRNPSKGSRVNNRAVMSRDVVMKQLILMSLKFNNDK
jgi:hypothetical protein